MEILEFYLAWSPEQVLNWATFVLRRMFKLRPSLLEPDLTANNNCLTHNVPIKSLLVCLSVVFKKNLSTGEKNATCTIKGYFLIKYEI